MKYNEATNFEINKAVAEALYGDRVHVEKIISDKSVGHYVFIDGFGPVNYCESPSDAWPIILEHKINLIFKWGAKEPLWTACNKMALVSGSKVEFKNENPLRAAMIVYLKMMEQ